MWPGSHLDAEWASEQNTTASPAVSQTSSEALAVVYAWAGARRQKVAGENYTGGPMGLYGNLGSLKEPAMRGVEIESNKKIQSNSQ